MGSERRLLWCCEHCEDHAQAGEDLALRYERDAAAEQDPERARILSGRAAIVRRKVACDRWAAEQYRRLARGEEVSGDAWLEICAHGTQSSERCPECEEPTVLVSLADIRRVKAERDEARAEARRLGAQLHRADCDRGRLQTEREAAQAEVEALRALEPSVAEFLRVASHGTDERTIAAYRSACAAVTRLAAVRRG